MHRLASRVRGQGFGVGIAGASAGAKNWYTGVAPYAYDYDGTNDYATRGADLTGIADGKQGTFSAWIRIDGGNGATRVIAGNGGNLTEPNERRFLAYLETDNKVYFFAAKADNTTLLFINSSAHTAGAAWLHVLASWNLATGDTHLYVNDVDENVETAAVNDTIDYTTGQFSVGAFSSGASKFNGCISELFFHTTYIDLSVAANRRKFITAGGKPQYLGVDGSAPLGVQPLLYAPTGDPSNNKGSGGNFTVTGALDAASTAPF